MRVLLLDGDISESPLSPVVVLVVGHRHSVVHEVADLHEGLVARVLQILHFRLKVSLNHLSTLFSTPHLILSNQFVQVDTALLDLSDIQLLKEQNDKNRTIQITLISSVSNSLSRLTISSASESLSPSGSLF